jgi:glycosyltransferase involved in cell wall biosynthesis
VKVVYVSTVDRGGPITHLRSLAPAVREAGADVRVACQHESLARMFDGTGVEVDVLPVGSKWDLRGARRLTSSLKGAHVVHAHDRRAAMFALPAARARGARAVYTYHGLPEDFAPLVGRPDDPNPSDLGRVRRTWVLRGLLPIEGWLGRLGAVVVPSQALADFLVAHGFPRERLVILPYGIDVVETPPRPTKTPVRVGTSAILIPRKAIDVMLDACAQVQVPVHVDVLGEGPLEADLQSRSARLGLDATFHGLVSDVRQLLSELDVFVLPTRGDNLPVAILEAMAAGLPVVASRTGGIPEQVIDGETGYLVEPGDVAGLGAAIERLAKDPERRLAFGLAGQRRIREHFDSRDIARRMVATYEGLCASST